MSGREVDRREHQIAVLQDDRRQRATSLTKAQRAVGERLAFIARDDKGVCEPRVVAAF